MNKFHALIKSYDELHEQADICSRSGYIFGSKLAVAERHPSQSTCCKDKMSCIHISYTAGQMALRVQPTGFGTTGVCYIV